MLEHLVTNKATAGDGANFKPTVWTGAAQAVNSLRQSGGPKTKESCQSKFRAVSPGLYVSMQCYLSH